MPIVGSVDPLFASTLSKVNSYRTGFYNANGHYPTLPEVTSDPNASSYLS
jgi:hypothetical protein